MRRFFSTRSAGYWPVSVLAVGLLVALFPTAYAQRPIFTLDPIWISGPRNFTSRIAMGDVDGDGDLDIIFGNVGPNHLYRNDGGTISTEPIWVTGPGNSTAAVAFADVDGDGDLDLICGNSSIQGGEKNTLYLNVNGQFLPDPVWTSKPANSTTNITLGDIDGDGDLDLVCGNSTLDVPQPNTLYLNVGGIFEEEPAWQSAELRLTTSVVLGDVDGDGDLDLVCGNAGISQNALYLNNNGQLDTVATWLSTPTKATWSIALGDVDGDGDLDLFCGNILARNCIYLNNGGIFSKEPDWRSSLLKDTFSVRVGDLDGDGDLDLVCTNQSESHTIYLNNGTMLDTLPAWESRNVPTGFGSALGDIDGDGDLDFAAGNRNASNWIFRNNSGAFSPNPVWTSDPANLTESAVLGDVDGDGDLDLVCGNDGQANTLYENQGGVIGTAPVFAWDLTSRTRSIVLADVNGDGSLDLVAGNHGQSNTIRFALVDSIWSSSPANNTRSVAVGDVDGDGDLDLVCGNSNQPNTLYRNNGGAFTTVPVWESRLSSTTGAVALGDVDGDGDLDLVCGNLGQPNTLYINEAGNLLEDPVWQSLPGNITTSIALGDVDGDGDLDLVCGNLSQSNVLYENIGGTFTLDPVWNSIPRNGTHDVALEDVDGDGDLDLVCGNALLNTLYLNEGGVLTTDPVWSSVPGNATHAVALGDIDNDGDPDLVCGNYNTTNTIYHELNNPPFKGDPSNPTNQLTNNSAFLKDVSLVPAGTNRFRIRFTAIDVESNPVLIVAEYQFEGAPSWFPMDVVGGSGLLADPYLTSPTGVEDSLDWDFLQVPFDDRNVVVRLRAVSNSLKNGLIQRVASYNKKVGSIIPRRQEIATSASELFFPTADIGDIVTAQLFVSNSGNELLTITDLVVPTTLNVQVDGAPPITIIPGARIELTVSFEPSTAADMSDMLRIDSDDPTTPSVVVLLSGAVRPLEFSLANLNPSGEIIQGDDLTISVSMDDSVRVDSVRVFYRPGGRQTFQWSRLTRIDDPENEQYFGTVPADSIPARGVEYFVEAYNGAARASSETSRLMTRVQSILFPSLQRAKLHDMISIPLNMEGTIIGTLEDDLGGRDDTIWRMFAFTASGYEELPNDSFFRFEQGRSYWLISKNAASLDTGPTEGLSAPTDGAYVLALEPGWNMLGNPFNFRVAWDSIMVDTLAMADALNSSILEAPISWFPLEKRYSDPVSEPVNFLDPFKGYWVMNNDTAQVLLRIPPVEATLAAPNETVTRNATDTDGKGDWDLRIRVSSGDVSDVGNHVGVRVGAVNERDRHDVREPPMSPGRSVALYFPHASWHRVSGNYTVDIRGEYEALDPDDFRYTSSDDDLWGHVWRFDVAKNFTLETAGDEVLLAFPGIESVPVEAHVLLVDQHLDRVVDVRNESHYVFFQGKRSLVQLDTDARFLLIVGSEAFVESREGQLPELPTQTVLRQNYPNPFNPTTIIRYEIAHTGDIALHIYDARGARIKELFYGHRVPGIYEEGWNGDNDRNEKVASGVYFYRLSAVNFTQTRKMVLLK